MARTRRDPNEPRKMETGLSAQEEANINSYSEQELRAKIEASAIAKCSILSEMEGKKEVKDARDAVKAARLKLKSVTRQDLDDAKHEQAMMDACYAELKSRGKAE